jgi:hypothetical protein
MARTPQISKEKQQSIITLRHVQSIRKISITLKVSSSAVYSETDSNEEERSHRKGGPELSDAEDKFIRVNSL